MRRIGALIFPGFELLDMFGPLQMFGLQREGTVASNQGPRAVAEASYETDAKYDLVLVPGGRGTRREVDNPATLSWLKRVHGDAELMLCVCTGGVKATTNKAAFDWVASQGPKVKWVKKARWVQDGATFTSSGVSAGMDMSLAVISHLLGKETAEQVAVWTEYDWHRDPDWDPFAAIHGLV
jgi:transcriptional regulator GlxA family with amidase domain